MFLILSAAIALAQTPVLKLDRAGLSSAKTSCGCVHGDACTCGVNCECCTPTAFVDATAPPACADGSCAAGGVGSCAGGSCGSAEAGPGIFAGRGVGPVRAMIARVVAAGQERRAARQDRRASRGGRGCGG